MNKKTLIKYAVITASSVFTLFFMGYHFGTFDQASHIPFLKKIYNPALYQNDPFFSLIKTHPSFFWFLFIPFLHFHVLEISLFIAYIFSIFFTYLAIWNLSNTIFRSFEINILSTIIWIVPHIGFAGFPMFEFSLVNRTFMLPFVLFSLSLYLKRNYLASFALTGLIMNFHALSTIYLSILYMSDILISRLYKKKAFIKNILVFLICSLPILFWSLTVHFNSSHVSTKEWFALISKAMMNNIFYPLHFNPPYIILTLNGFGGLLLFFYSIKNIKTNTQAKTVRNFMIGILISISTFFISSYLYPIEIIVKTQLIRIGIFVLIFGYLFSISYIWQQYKKTKDKKLFLISYIILAGSIFPLFSLFHLILQKKQNMVLVLLALALCTTFFSAYFTYTNNIWKPEIHIYPRTTDYYKAQKWAQYNTPKNSVFITPPYAWGIYEPEWRVFSERSSLVFLSDTLEMAFNPEYYSVWKNRFNDLIPTIIKKFTFNYFENNNLVKAAYLSLPYDHIMGIAKKYKANYFVTENTSKYPFPIVYKNNTYTIYSLSRDSTDSAILVR